jgi:predicted metal-binding protein
MPELFDLPADTEVGADNAPCARSYNQASSGCIQSSDAPESLKSSDFVGQTDGPPSTENQREAAGD